MRRLLLPSLCLCVACSGSGAGGTRVIGAGDGGSVDAAPIDAGAAGIVIEGMVAAADGAPVVADLRLDGTEATARSAADGRYAIRTAAPALAPGVRASFLVEAHAPGFAPQRVLVPLKADVAAYRAPIVLVPLASRELPPGRSEHDVPLAGGSGRVRVEAGGVSGAVLRFAALGPATAPGELRAAAADAGEALQSAGMLWVDVVDAAGVPVEDVVAEVVVDPSNVTEVPESEPWMGWRQDADGRWADPTPPRREPDGALAFPVREFGFWNADRAYRTGCVRGRLVTPAAACGGVRVQSTGPDGISSFDTADADGGFCVVGAQTFPAQLSVGRATRAVQMPASAGDCTAPQTCADLGEVRLDEAECADAGAPGVGARGPGEPCVEGAECIPGSICFQGYCVGEGALRVSLSFDADSDFDLHLRTPGGAEISFANEVADGGTLDVDSCVARCGAGPHVENIVFAEVAPSGEYVAWVENYDGRAGGAFVIEVEGAGITERFFGELAASDGSTSERFSFRF